MRADGHVVEALYIRSLRGGEPQFNRGLHPREANEDHPLRRHSPIYDLCQSRSGGQVQHPAHCGGPDPTYRAKNI